MGKTIKYLDEKSLEELLKLIKERDNDIMLVLNNMSTELQTVKKRMDALNNLNLGEYD